MTGDSTQRTAVCAVPYATSKQHQTAIIIITKSKTPPATRTTLPLGSATTKTHHTPQSWRRKKDKIFVGSPDYTRHQHHILGEHW